MANNYGPRFIENREEPRGPRKRLFMNSLDLTILRIIRDDPGLSASEAVLRTPGCQYRSNKSTGKRYASTKDIYRCKVLRERGYLKKGKAYKPRDKALYMRTPLFITKAGERVLEQHQKDMFG